MNEDRIAIVVVTYNRIKSLERLLNSLCGAYYSGTNVDLIISVDKSNTNQVESFADSFYWKFGEKIVDKHQTNLGLKKHILSLGKWLGCYDAIVVLEDDLLVSPGFYSYASQCVKKYKDDDRIAGISLYGFEVNYQNQKPFMPMHDANDVYFMNCAMSWGQVWMREQWNHFKTWYDLNSDFTYSNKIPFSLYKWGDKSWLKYHTRYCIEENKYFVFPYVSYSTNFSEIGVNHAGLQNVNTTVYQVVINNGKCPNLRLPDLSDNCIKYDGYFENTDIYRALSLSPDLLCIDINGTNDNAQRKRFHLTCEIKNYKIVKRFGMVMRPADINVINGINGSDIFLYDTSVYDNNRFKRSGNEILYLYKIESFSSFIKMAGLFAFSKSISISIFNRIKRIVKCK